MTKKINIILFAAILSFGFLSSCEKEDVDMPNPNALNLPNELEIPIDNFYPEDTKVVNNTVYVSSAINGSVFSFDLTEESPTSQTFAAAESGYAQSWGLQSDGKVLLNILNNADFSGGGNPPGASKLVEYNLSTGNKTNEWDLHANTVGHTVSIVDGKYYVTDAFQPKIIEVDPSNGNVNGSWFISTQLSHGFGAPVRVDGSTLGKDENTIYYTYNDVFDAGDAGIVYKLEFSNSTTAVGSVVSTGFDDPSGIGYLENKGMEYLFVCESQFGSQFGLNTLETPFKVKIETVN